MRRYQGMVRVLSRRMVALDEAGRLELARETVAELGGPFDPDVCALLLEELDKPSAARVEPWLDSLADTANGAWLRTRLLPDGVASVRAWERLASFGVRCQPLDLVAWSRALAATGAYEEAGWKLRLALEMEPDHVVLARAEKLVRDLAGRVSSNLRQAKIAVVGSSTTGFLTPMLQALCFRDRIGVEIYETPHGLMAQEIRNPDSGLARFRPDIVILLMHWRDLQLDAVTADEQAWIAEFVSQRKADWERLPCHVIQPSFDFPASEAYGHLSGVLPGGRTRMIELLNPRLREAAGGNVSILDMAAVQREVGSRWEDTVGWARYRQHPSVAALPALAESYLAQVRAALGLSRKVLVTDLDNTLWGGVIGEDGVDGIRVGPDSHEGEAHLSLQRYMLDLKRRGVLLAVCSKNNPEDARLPFLRHVHMALRLEDFAAFRVNWEDKASNLRGLADELSLGLESFVFLDDNPLEREWVRSQLPEVAVVEPGPSPFQWVRQLDRGRYFEALSLSGEDSARAEHYREGARRETLRAEAESLDDFLRNLHLEASVEPVTEKNLKRVTQLVNKTNQFNVTARRYNEAQVQAIAAEADGWAGAFRMSDRMGSYGLIGVLFCQLLDGEAWEIDTWLMSCRTLGRQMEKFMFDRLVEAACARGIRKVVGVYRPTAKNGLVKDLYGQMGFRSVGEEGRYELTVPEMPVVTATHVRDVTEGSG